MAAKERIVTFKVDAGLAAALRGMPNRSDFLRAAVLAALDNACPLCRGTGVLSPRQMEHWKTFAETHALTECAECHEFHLVCSAAGRGGKSRAPRHASA